MSSPFQRYRLLRRLRYLTQYLIPCLRVAIFTRQGIWSRKGRILIWGKFRRMFLGLFPPLARQLQLKHGIAGGCRSCGASCRLLLKCPHWDEVTHLCSIYEDRPTACRLFPITPEDLRDRDLVLEGQDCGYVFVGSAPTEAEPITFQHYP